MKTSVNGFRYEGDRRQPIETQVIMETSLNLSVNGESWLTFMCTPVDMEALAVGFLFNEGLVESKKEIASVRVCPSGDMVDVWLTHAVKKPETWRRTSGCTGGMTGVETPATPAQARPTRDNFSLISDATRSGDPLDGILTLSPVEIRGLVASLYDSQDLYRVVGGVHTSGLSDGKRILVIADDIGRHNTLDKIAGRLLLDEINPHRRLLITTGRISSEMIQKAIRMGASVVVSRTAPSSLSVEIAQQAGITLIGYVKNDRFLIYAHPERILSQAEGEDFHTN